MSIKTFKENIEIMISEVKNIILIVKFFVLLLLWETNYM